MAIEKKGKFKIDVYGITVHIIICSDSETVTEECNKMKRKYKEPDEDFSCHGLVFTPDVNLSVLYLFLSSDDLNVNTITHETDHIRNFIIDYKSLHENSDAKEASANLNGYINEKVFKFLHKNEIPFNY